MLSSREKFSKVKAGLDSLDFLKPKDGFLPWPSYMAYYIEGTGLYLEISYHAPSDSFSIAYLSQKPIRWAMDFEKFFDLLPEDIKEKVIFHLDLFR
jgi:hypothetical protein